MRASIGCALTLMILSSAACHNMKPVSVTQVTGNNRVWLTLSDRSVVVVDGPQIYGTKVVGFVNGRYGEFPTARVAEVRVREQAGGRTAAVVAASVLAAGVVAYWGLSTVGDKGAGNPTPDICDVEPDNELCG
jgi:hypothetical protein